MSRSSGSGPDGCSWGLGLQLRLFGNRNSWLGETHHTAEGLGWSVCGEQLRLGVAEQCVARSGESGQCWALSKESEGHKDHGKDLSEGVET